MLKIRWRMIAGAIALALVALSACSSAGALVSANTLCSDFMKLSANERDDAVNRLAVELNNPDVVTPVGRPNVEYMCAQTPSMTIGQVIQGSRLPGQAATPSPTPSTLPSDDAPSTTEPVVQESFKDSDGYSYTWGVRSKPRFTVTSDVANAKPGEALLTLVVNADLFITNTTNARNAPLPFELKVGAVWKKGSIACKLDIAHVMSPYDPGSNDSDYCILTDKSVRTGPAIPAGETEEWSWQRTATVNVPEADVDAFTEELQAPAFIAIGRPSGKYNCVMSTGIFVSATSTPTTCKKS